MSVRIIGGTHRGRKIKTVQRKNLRPTSGLLRKVIFDLIGPRIVGEAVLDLFAGTGSLGLEALSRGAEQCVFVERDRISVEVLRENIVDLGLESRASVVYGDAVRYLKDKHSETDGVLIDPPYRFADILEKFNPVHLLKPEGWLVYQHSEKTGGGFAGEFKRCREKKHGNTIITIYER